MSDEKKYTERELVVAQRAAYGHGARWYRAAGNCTIEIDREARRCYPLPRVTRARVVNHGHGREWQWKFEDGRFHFRFAPKALWEIANEAWAPTLQTVPIWADLLANPIEEVDSE